jgi:hypothetical protein
VTGLAAAAILGVLLLGPTVAIVEPIAPRKLHQVHDGVALLGVELELTRVAEGSPDRADDHLALDATMLPLTQLVRQAKAIGCQLQPRHVDARPTAQHPRTTHTSACGRVGSAVW